MAISFSYRINLIYPPASIPDVTGHPPDIGGRVAEEILKWFVKKELKILGINILFFT